MDRPNKNKASEFLGFIVFLALVAITFFAFSALRQFWIFDNVFGFEQSKESLGEVLWGTTKLMGEVAGALLGWWIVSTQFEKAVSYPKFRRAARRLEAEFDLLSVEEKKEVFKAQKFLILRSIYQDMGAIQKSGDPHGHYLIDFKFKSIKDHLSEVRAAENFSEPELKAHFFKKVRFDWEVMVICSDYDIEGTIVEWEHILKTRKEWSVAFENIHKSIGATTEARTS